MPRRIGPGGPWIAAPVAAPNAADQVPFSRAWLPAVLATWTVALAPLWLNGFTQEAQAYVPPERAWVETVRQQWEPADPPRQGLRYIPQSADQPTNPRLWLNGILSQWLPSAWDAQVREPAPQAAFYDPPFGMRAWLQPLSAWEQPAWGPQSERDLLQTAAVVDAPPVGYRPWLKSLESWAPSPSTVPLWQNGFVLPAPADQPAGVRSWFPTVREAWEPQAYPPQGWRHLVPAPTADNPPFEQERLAHWIRQAWEAEAWPTQERASTPQGVAAADRAVGSRAWLQALTWWTQEEPARQARDYLVQGFIAAADAPPIGYRPWLKSFAWSEPQLVPLWASIGAQGAQIDNPPFEQERLPETIRRAWDPEPWAAQASHQLVQGTPPVADAPPLGQRGKLPGLIASWEQKLVVPLWGIAGAQGQDLPPPDSPPTGYRPWLKALNSWAPSPILVWQNGVLGQGEDVPPYVRSWLASVIGAWEPEWTRPQTLRHVVQGFVPDAPPVTDRPWLAWVNQAWEPAPYPAQGWRHLLQGTPAPVNNPPFGLSPRIWRILASWEPGPPLPQAPKRIARVPSIAFTSEPLRARIGTTPDIDTHLRIGNTPDVDTHERIGPETGTVSTKRIGDPAK